MKQQLSEFVRKKCRQTDGYATPLGSLCRALVKTYGPHWATPGHKRLKAVLAEFGFVVGVITGIGSAVANLDGPASQRIASRALALDEGYEVLEPREIMVSEATHLGNQAYLEDQRRVFKPERPPKRKKPRYKEMPGDAKSVLYWREVRHEKWSWICETLDCSVPTAMKLLRKGREHGNQSYGQSA